MRFHLPTLGHPLIDRQHRRILALARRLIAAAGRGRGRGELGELLRATQRHFASEDRLMVRHRYPELGGHRALHDGVVADMRRMQAQLRQGQPLHHRHAAQVVEWLGHHADAADRNLVAHLALTGT
jgi:hemerythrin-like metal-binding protein